MLRGNLHTHSVLSDGVLTPEEIVERYRQAGYDFVAFTDHRSLIDGNDEQEYWAKLPESTADFLVLRGVEEEPTALFGRHMGVISGPREELRIINHPVVYGMTVEDVAGAVARVHAHAVEVTYHGQYFELFDVDAYGVPRIATDDAHLATELCVAWVEVDARRDADDILRAIKAGRFRNAFSPRGRPAFLGSS